MRNLSPSDLCASFLPQRNRLGPTPPPPPVLSVILHRGNNRPLPLGLPLPEGESSPMLHLTSWRLLRFFSDRERCKSVQQNALGESCRLLHRERGSAFTATQCGPTGGPPATSGPELLVTSSVKWFVKLFLVTTSSFTLFILKDLKKSWFLFRLLLYL
jgi:hypothetical protein